VVDLLSRAKHDLFIVGCGQVNTWPSAPPAQASDIFLREPLLRLLVC